MTTDVRFTVEVETRGSNVREHPLARKRRVDRERRALALAWMRSGLSRGVEGMLRQETVLRLPRGVPVRTRKLAKLANFDLRREESITRPLVPLDVHLTRVSSGELDPFENLPVSLKAIVDEIARQMDVNDRDPIVRWVAHQERGPRRYHAVKVQIVVREVAAAERQLREVYQRVKGSCAAPQSADMRACVVPSTPPAADQSGAGRNEPIGAVPRGTREAG